MHYLNSTKHVQPPFNATSQDFERPLNTTLEDSIHMPQNYNNRNRRRQPQGAGSRPQRPNAPIEQPAIPTSPSHDASTTARLNTDTAPVPMWDNASGAIHDIPRPSRAELVSASYDEPQVPIPRGLFEPSGFNATPRRDSMARRPPPLVSEREIRARIRRADFRPITEAMQSPRPVQGGVSAGEKSGDGPARSALADKDANRTLGKAGAGRTLYSKIHEKKSTWDGLGAGDKGAHGLAVVVDEPLPLKVFRKRPALASQGSSSTLDHVRQLRAAEQEKKIAVLCKDLSAVRIEDSGVKDDVPASDKGSSKMASTMQKTPDLLPDLKLSDSDWAKPLHAMATATLSETGLKVAPRSQTATTQSANDGVDQAIESLAMAMGDISYFQNIVSSPPTHRTYERKSAIPAPLEVSAIKVADNAQKIGVKDQLGPSLPMPGTKAEAPKEEKQKPVQESAKASKESIATVSSGTLSEYERVGTPVNMESDQNGGVRRKWYKGFRR
tara:strand:- start:11823 stop:13316 length:1494 start_codon:yes stop_codon:yes gene_type:complete